MATVNKSSLRAEFDALKARFESLCAAGKMSAESRALVDALLMLFELLMAVFMEKHTPKSSANSSLPASQSPNDDTARTRPGAKGKGPSYNDARCANTRTRESIRVLSVDACQRCGEDLTDAACTGRERRTLIDIVFEKVVRHVDAQIKHCARCHTETRARFPLEMPGPLQYGPGIKAYVVHLLIAQMLSLKRVAQSMHALIGRTLSEATLLGYVAQLHHALAQWESHAIERLLASPAMHVDETSLRVDRKNHWIHVYSAGTLTVKCLHPKRGCEAIEAIGIIPRYGGVDGPRLLGLVSELHALRPRLVRGTFVARTRLHRRRPWLRLGQAHEAAAPWRLSSSLETRRQDADPERVQGAAETLPHHPHPRGERASTHPTERQRT